MTRARRRRLSRPVKIWLSLLATVAGGLVVTTLALQVDSARDTDLGDERRDVSSRFAHTVPANAPAIRFTDVAAELGLDFVHAPGPRARLLTEDTGSGLAWGDYDDDGDPDLYVVDLTTTSADGGNRLFRNDGGSFTDVTAVAGVGDRDGMGMGASFADYDADGDLDLYVTNVGANRLFRNDGSTFTDVTESARVAGRGWSVGVTWGDYDRDGHLDLYVCNYIDYDLTDEDIDEGVGDGKYVAPPRLNPKVFEPQPNHLFRNLGDGTFDDVASDVGVADPAGRSLAAVMCDLDGDGWLDIYVANDVSPNALFHNAARAPDAGGVRFENWAMRTGTADLRGSMGLSILDVTGQGGAPDGVPDLFVTHWVAQQNAMYQGVRAVGGGLVFLDKARALRLGEVSSSSVGWGCAFVDLDHDGRRDILVANGSTLEAHDGSNALIAQRMFVFWNDGGRFHDLAPVAGEACATPRVARGLALADFDGDGDQDTAITINRGRLVLLRNDTEGTPSAVTVRLRGPAAACFGARVVVRHDAGTDSAWYAGDVSFASGHDPGLHFGLGQAVGAVSVDVHWSDGSETRGVDVDAGVMTIRHR